MASKYFDEKTLILFLICIFYKKTLNQVEMSLALFSGWLVQDRNGYPGTILKLKLSPIWQNIIQKNQQTDFIVSVLLPP